DFYIEPYLQFARTPDRVCLCGALAGEIPTLPPEMRMRVDQFFKTHHAWLAGILGPQREIQDVIGRRPPEETNP
ncbi:hypothetical protein, partial [Hypericibacter sp.]|uniref:hypothetical protein n=1 Tax=Hypericibacter sp. TaxID=2705401 RepID=UPI003D6CC276